MKPVKGMSLIEWLHRKKAFACLISFSDYFRLSLQDLQCNLAIEFLLLHLIVACTSRFEPFVISLIILKRFVATRIANDFICVFLSFLEQFSYVSLSVEIRSNRVAIQKQPARIAKLAFENLKFFSFALSRFNRLFSQIFVFTVCNSIKIHVLFLWNLG